MAKRRVFIDEKPTFLIKKKKNFKKPSSFWKCSVMATPDERFTARMRLLDDAMKNMCEEMFDDDISEITQIQVDRARSRM